MAKAPAWQWYPKDCDTDENVRGMDDREFGFYVRCLNHSWLNDGIPADLDELARIMGRTRKYLDTVWVRVGKCFVADGDRLRNPKQESLRKKQNEYSDSRRSGAVARWSKQEQCTTDARASEMQCSAVSVLHTASASADSISEHAPSPKRTFTLDVWADRLYSKHVKRRDRSLVNAELFRLHQRCLQRGVDPEQKFTEIEACLIAWNETSEWRENNGRFAPKLADWLRDEGFDQWPKNGAAATQMPKYIPPWEGREDA